MCAPIYKSYKTPNTANATADASYVEQTKTKSNLRKSIQSQGENTQRPIYNTEQSLLKKRY